MKTFIFLFIFFLLVPFVAAADSCDAFCTMKEYDYGSCRETWESGFCAGNSEEDVYSFSQCTDFERCCCGYSGAVAAENDTIDTVAGEPVCQVAVPVAETLFWFLLILVMLLALAYWMNGGNKEDVIVDQSF
ncbi:MAG TPA: hypothetical protein VJJ79_01565 [Candidatus Nanoarchaeia archaeon]|nr:hypothetical protein [Candidatus Nanoarchaeia archaeon]